MRPASKNMEPVRPTSFMVMPVDPAETKSPLVYVQIDGRGAMFNNPAKVVLTMDDAMALRLAEHLIAGVKLIHDATGSCPPVRPVEQRRP